METALSEAAYMTGLEKNSDIVKMASYAPLFAKEDDSQWTPDMIWFNGDQVYGTPSYYVQQQTQKQRILLQIKGLFIRCRKT
jgi:alpha-L-arabinofuranosidase